MILVDDLPARLGAALCAQGLRMGTAESCTGGLMASTLTDTPGSSAWFEGGVVSYDNRAKVRLLGVSEDILDGCGAVSRECVEAMVCGLCAVLCVPVGIAVSGIAGPSGGSPEKPVGTVWMAWSVQNHLWSRAYHFAGTRKSIKEQSVLAGLSVLEAFLTKNGAS
jgi:nicotinamide-nucleotide amidase